VHVTAYLMLLPRTLIWSTEMGFLPFGVIFTARRCVFIATSTPVHKSCCYQRTDVSAWLWNV